MGTKGQRLSPEARRRVGAARRLWFEEHPEHRARLGEERVKAAEERADKGFEGITQKECTKCHVYKPLDEFHRRKAKLSSGREVIRLEPSCKTCKRAYFKRWKANKEEEGWSYNADQRRRWAERTEKQKARYREQQREWYQVKRRKEGIAPRKRTTIPQGRDLVPSAPLKRFINEQLAHQSPGELTGFNETLGRRLRDVLNGNGEVELRIVDQILTNLARPEILNELYPYK